MRLSSLASSALATLASATASPLDPAPSGARRRLLGHCFDEFGGHHTDDRADAAGSNGTDASAFGGTNWAAVETGVHADPLVVRLVYWLVYVLAAVVLLIAMLTIWPPPDRVFPRKRPALRVVPWCLLGRMLGYGVIDWREGRLTPFPRYFRERHEVLSLWLGDMRFITFRARLTHFFAGIACTASLSMGLTDLESGRVTGDFWLVQVWVFGALFVYEIVLGIALRVSAVGASERALAAPTIASARRIEREYFGACFVFSFACLACSITFVHVMDEGGGCGDAFNTFLAYSYVFGLYEIFSWFALHPAIIALRWWLGRAFLRVSVDAETDEETMACCWKTHACARCPWLCACAPQPSAAVDADGVARDDDESDGESESSDRDEPSASALYTPDRKRPSGGQDDASVSGSVSIAAAKVTVAPFDASRAASAPSKHQRWRPSFPRRAYPPRPAPSSSDPSSPALGLTAPTQTTSPPRAARLCAGWDADVESGIASASFGSSGASGAAANKSRRSRNGLRASSAGFERGLVVGWRMAAATTTANAAKDAALKAEEARREAHEQRTALARAKAAEAEAKAAAAEAAAAAAEAKAAAAEAATARLALGARRRPNAPAAMEPPTPQSVASGGTRSGTAAAGGGVFSSGGDRSGRGAGGSRGGGFFWTSRAGGGGGGSARSGSASASGSAGTPSLAFSPFAFSFDSSGSTPASQRSVGSRPRPARPLTPAGTPAARLELVLEMGEAGEAGERGGERGGEGGRGGA